MIGPIFGYALLAASAVETWVSRDHPFGWLGSMLLAALGGLTLWRAGSVKAWKETAEARAERLEDLEREMGELRTELSIPERIEGIVTLMAEQSARADEAANRRLASALDRLEAGAEKRTSAVLQAIEATCKDT